VTLKLAALSSGLPELIVSGNRILRSDTMRPLLLSGINRSGLEYTYPTDAGWLSAARFTLEEVREIIVNWGANVLRVPFNQKWALTGANGHSAEEYLASLDQVITWAAEVGAYTVLDLQWLDTETIYGHVKQQGREMENHVPPLPNADSIKLWRTLAARYRNEPAVLFDLLNEPHHPIADDPYPLLLMGADGKVSETEQGYVTAGDWVRWAEYLIREIRAIRPEGIILVGGVDWGFDLRDVRLQAPNIVYSAHIYSNRKPTDWSRAIERNAEAPVFIGEWGGGDQDLKFGQTLARQMRRLGLGWCAWSWADYPQLIKPPGAPQFAPTLFGELVRDELKSSV